MASKDPLTVQSVVLRKHADVEEVAVGYEGDENLPPVRSAKVISVDGKVC
jgi:hypothetical protein